MFAVFLDSLLQWTILAMIVTVGIGILMLGGTEVPEKESTD